MAVLLHHILPAALNSSHRPARSHEWMVCSCRRVHFAMCSRLADLVKSKLSRSFCGALLLDLQSTAQCLRQCLDRSSCTLLHVPGFAVLVLWRPRRFGDPASPHLGSMVCIAQRPAQHHCSTIVEGKCRPQELKMLWSRTLTHSTFFVGEAIFLYSKLSHHTLAVCATISGIRPLDAAYAAICAFCNHSHLLLT